ncbi:MAG: mechanosensitive ion channel [Lachnospiraceae bacterium]|nr:mechanosensitive ion channel [Lachnospiraceae bacterium]
MNGFNLLANEANFAAEVSKLDKVWDAFWPVALNFLKSLAIALIIFLVGKKIIKWVLKLIKKAFAHAGVEEGVSGFVGSLVKVILYLVLVMMMANIVGIETTSVMAIVGSAGLTVGLALQGSLSNFAGGVLILVLKPFSVGDYIVAQGCEGTVQKIDIFYTKLLTTDNRAIVLPNGTLSNGNIINVSREEDRRVDLVVPIGYNDDIREVKRILESIARTHIDTILQDKDITVAVGNFGSDAIEINFRVWVKKDNYWLVRGELLEEIKDAFDANNISIPYSQMDVHIKQN